MLGKKWSPQDVMKSISISSKNFISLEEFEKLKQHPGYVDANSFDFRRVPQDQVVTPLSLIHI